MAGINVYLKVRMFPPKFVRLRMERDTFPMDVLNFAFIFPRCTLHKTRPHWFLLWKIVDFLLAVGVWPLRKIGKFINDRILDPSTLIIELF